MDQIRPMGITANAISASHFQWLTNFGGYSAGYLVFGYHRAAVWLYPKVRLNRYAFGAYLFAYLLLVYQIPRILAQTPMSCVGGGDNFYLLFHFGMKYSPARRRPPGSAVFNRHRL